MATAYAGPDNSEIIGALISGGSNSHGVPVRSTKTMPVSTARSGSRGRPPRGRGGTGGNSGSISSHNASLTKGLAIDGQTCQKSRFLLGALKTICLFAGLACRFGAVLRRLGLLFAAFAFFSIAGGHWAVLQTVAWAEMLRDYTQQTGSVAVAVEQTFGGAHPCELCLQIEAARQQEAKAQSDRQKSDSNQKVAKAEKNGKALALDPLFSSVWMAATRLCRDDQNSLAGPSRSEQPPTPPPRSGTVAA